jgi:hypothetical protein
MTFTAAALLALAAAPLQAGTIDISAAFNGDTFATSTSDSAGVGYRGTNNEKFLTAPLPVDGVLTPSGGPTFQFGSYTADNTVLLESSGAAASVTINIPDQRMNSFSVVHSGVGFNIASASKNGTATVNYLDGSTDVLFWDLADNDGNNADGQSQTAIGGLTLRVFGSGTQSTANRRLWYQTFTGVNAAKTVDSITFDASAVGTPPNHDTDADFGLYAMSATASPYVIVDISSKFNRDTIAVADTEPDGGGYRNNGDRFVTSDFNGGTNTPNLPPTGEVVAGGTPFEIGPFDDPDTTQNNTWIKGIGEANDELDIADIIATKVSVLFTGVGFNASASPNGQFTIFYTDSTSDVFTWDLADSQGGTNLSGLAAAAISGMDLWNTNTDAFFSTNNRILFYQDFMANAAKTIDRIAFNTLGVTDPSNDAQFGIYAVTLTIPEPASLLILAPIGVVMMIKRRK